MKIQEDPRVREFYRISNLDLVRITELGTHNFQEIEGIILSIKKMIHEMISILSEREDIILIDAEGQVYDFVSSFNAYINGVLNYNINNDPSIRQKIIEPIREMYSAIFRGTIRTGASHNQIMMPFNFLSVYNFLKNYNISNTNSLMEKEERLNNLISENKSLKDDLEQLYKTLKEKATDQTLTDYSQIFSNQCRRHNNTSYVWLVSAIIITIIFITFVLNIDCFIPIDETANTALITIKSLSRLLITSFFIYIITFAFKQFSIQKHLFTLNQHRANTLNSYKLFIGSLDERDPATQNVLMMEVAKAIYESGNTGYLSSKNDSDNSSIIEISKFMSQPKS